VSGAHANFQGSIPDFYDRCLGPFLFEPYAADLARRLPASPDARVLELACGTGVATRSLRAALPAQAHLVATDLNPAMLDVARANLVGVDVHWRTADAAALPFKDEAFDAVACQFGMMFLPDRAQGFRESRRVLRRGGTFLASVWCSLEENPAAGIIHEIVGRMFPSDPPQFLRTPYGSVNEEMLRTLAVEAGFVRVAVERVALEGRAVSARLVATGFAKGSPLSQELLAHGADLGAVVDALEGPLAEHGGTPFRSPLTALVLTAS